MGISAAQVKELRQRTGLGMMECKSALAECGGDMEKAIELLRKRAGAKVEKKARRIAAEGLVSIHMSEDRKLAAMVEVNCETDFVAKEESFIEFARATAACVAEQNPADKTVLLSLPLDDSKAETVAQACEHLGARLGEKINVRRFIRYEAQGDHLDSYVHGGRIGVLIDIHGGNDTLAHDLAMHVAALRPEYISHDDVPPDVVAQEKEILTAQARDSGKPADIVEKMIAGRLRKYIDELTLLGQPFVKDHDMTVERLLKSAGAAVRCFHRYEVGEGLEKKTSDFATDVIMQVKGG